MATSYAAVVSLMNTLEHVQIHPRLSTSLDKYQMESLNEKLDFLLQFMESYSNNSHGGSKEVADLESEIAAAAHAAEDVIEFHVVDQIHAGAIEKGPSFVLDLQKIIQDMDSIKAKVMKVKAERGVKDQQPMHSISMPAASSRSLSIGKRTMVGFDDYLIQLLDRLTGEEPDRQIIPITGMGGIGKTTLARNVYDHLLIAQHFDVRAWVTVSQVYNVREILREALSCLRVSTHEMDKKTEDQLGRDLHKKLSGRRYLIIIDDMWSIEVWDSIKFFFPEKFNRSRIIVTSRILEVANYFGSSRLSVNFLNDDQSWSLFCEKVFEQEDCPHELKEIGRKIVERCKGLPLSIVVISGLLSKSPRTQKHWESVARDISSILSSAENNQCLNILSLSYNHLPICLKPCFLYLGIYPEDYEISVSRVIKLWVAEGFIKPNSNQNLEEVARSYIKDLIDRNLIIVRGFGRLGNFKNCYIHDLVRDFCLRMAEKEKFFCVTRALDTPHDIDKERRILNHGSINKHEECTTFHTLQSTSLIRSIIGSRGVLSCESRLLRVMSEVYDEPIEHTFQWVNLRYVAYQKSARRWTECITPCELTSPISSLWNVQTLIITTGAGEFVAPSEIWEMPQLRHIEFLSLCLPDPCPSDEQDGIVLRNLLTLKEVLNFKCSKEVCKRMPNIKKIWIQYTGSWEESETSLSDYCLYNVGRLNKLESLQCSFHKKPNRDVLVQNLSLPRSLKKLWITGCMLHWDDLTVLGSLPHLEVLELGCHSVTGPHWNPIEGEFLRLKFLRICRCPGLIYWNADNSHYPVLENLTLEDMWDLNEIPLDIGEIPTLEVIHVKYGQYEGNKNRVQNYNTSAAISAMKILEEQQNVGNENLRVEINFFGADERDEFREMVEQEGFTCQNFQLLGGA